MQVRVEARSDSPGAVCVFCRDTLDVQRGATCEACGARFHRSCLGDPPTCPTLGCQGQISGRFLPLTGRASQGQSALLAMLTAIALGSLVMTTGIVGLISVLRGASEASDRESMRREQAARDRRNAEAQRLREAEAAQSREAIRRAEEQRRADIAAAQRRRAEEEAARRAATARPPVSPQAQAWLERARQDKLESRARVVVRGILKALRRGDRRELGLNATPEACEILVSMGGWSEARVMDPGRVIDSTVELDVARGPSDPLLRFRLSGSESALLLREVEPLETR